jgi:hypothetical protein
VNSDATAVRPAGLRRVRVWFCEHVIACQVAEPALAARFEAAMRRRFPSCRVTNEPLAPCGDRS